MLIPDPIGIIDAHVGLGVEHHLRLEPDELLVQMDASGVATAIARSVGSELVVRNREGNERLLKMSPRIASLVTANPWYGADAIEVLRAGHGGGGVGLYLHPTRQGFMPTDRIAEPLIELAAGVDWPV